MHLIITDAWLAKSRAMHLTGTRLVLSGLVLSLGLMVVAAAMYHWVFLKGAREGWPVIGSLVRLVVKDEFEQRDRFMRENLDQGGTAVVPLDPGHEGSKTARRTKVKSALRFHHRLHHRVVVFRLMQPHFHPV